MKRSLLEILKILRSENDVNILELLNDAEWSNSFMPMGNMYLGICCKIQNNSIFYLLYDSDDGYLVYQKDRGIIDTNPQLIIPPLGYLECYENQPLDDEYSTFCLRFDNNTNKVLSKKKSKNYPHDVPEFFQIVDHDKIYQFLIGKGIIKCYHLQSYSGIFYWTKSKLSYEEKLCLERKFMKFRKSNNSE